MIDQNKSRDLFQPITVAVCKKTNEDRTTRRKSLQLTRLGAVGAGASRLITPRPRPPLGAQTPKPPLVGHTHASPLAGVGQTGVHVLPAVGAAVPHGANTDPPPNPIYANPPVQAGVGETLVYVGFAVGAWVGKKDCIILVRIFFILMT